MDNGQNTQLFRKHGSSGDTILNYGVIKYCVPLITANSSRGISLDYGALESGIIASFTKLTKVKFSFLC